MTIKRVLKFYFCVDGYSKLLDWKIRTLAENSVNLIGAECAEEICNLLCEKDALAELWGYLDKVLSGFTESERRVLKFYSVYRFGAKGLNDAVRAEIKRCAVKFRRRARRLESFTNSYAVMAKYCCAVYGL